MWGQAVFVTFPATVLKERDKGNLRKEGLFFVCVRISHKLTLERAAYHSREAIHAGHTASIHHSQEAERGEH